MVKTGPAKATAADYAQWRERIRSRGKARSKVAEPSPEPDTFQSYRSFEDLGHKETSCPATDPWDQIGVGKDASLEEVTTAFRRKVKHHHPDFHMGADESTRRKHIEEFCSIMTAYQGLRARLET